MPKLSQPRPSLLPLRGIIPPLVTPLADRDVLDVAGLERLVEHLLAGGVHGLFLLGTTGEGPSLSYRLRRELIQRVCRQVAERVPVLVGITDTALSASVELAYDAARAGAAAVVAAPPCYFPLGQDELFHYLETLAAEVCVPLVLYNMPSHTKLHFELETLARAMEIPNIVGLKDSSGNMLYFQQVRRLIAARSSWSLLIGPEELLAESVLLGGDGGISGGANFHPRLYVALYEAARDGHLDRVRDLQTQVEEISGTIYRIGPPPSCVLRGIKGVLGCLGICSDRLAEPLLGCTDVEREVLAQHLERLGLLEPQPAG